MSCRFCVEVNGVEKDVAAFAKYLKTSESNVRTKFNYHRKIGKTEEQIVAHLVQGKKDKVRLIRSFGRHGEKTVEPIVETSKRGRGRPKMKTTQVREMMEHLSKKSITYKGATKTREEWQKESGASDELVYDRITQGWEEEAAVSQPPSAPISVIAPAPVITLVSEMKTFDTLKGYDSRMLASVFAKTFKDVLFLLTLKPEALKLYEDEKAQAIAMGNQILTALGQEVL